MYKLREGGRCGAGHASSDTAHGCHAAVQDQRRWENSVLWPSVLEGTFLKIYTRTSTVGAAAEVGEIASKALACVHNGLWEEALQLCKLYMPQLSDRDRSTLRDELVLRLEAAVTA